MEILKKKVEWESNLHNLSYCYHQVPEGEFARRLFAFLRAKKASKTFGLKLLRGVDVRTAEAADERSTNELSTYLKI